MLRETPLRTAGTTGDWLGPEKVGLLRACLLDHDESSEAWRSWLETVGDPEEFIRNDVAGVRRILPLLYEAGVRSDLAMSAPLSTLLKCAGLHERLRQQTFLRVLASVVEALDAASVHAICLNGIAMAYAVYETPALRHFHDADFLIAAPQIDAAESALRRAGLARAARSDATLVFRHESGTSVSLHTRPRFGPVGAADIEALYRDGLDIEVDAIRLKGLQPSRMLLQALTQQGLPRDLPLHVFCDVWFLIRRYPEARNEKILAALDPPERAVFARTILGWIDGEFSV